MREFLMIVAFVALTFVFTMVLTQLLLECNSGGISEKDSEDEKWKSTQLD